MSNIGRCMIPIKGQSAGSVAQILDGCKVVISGSFPKPLFSQVVVKAIAEDLGATVLSSVTATATHLVTTFDDYSKPSAKVAKAQQLGIHIVTLEWLLLCADGTKKPEADYLPHDDADADVDVDEDADEDADADDEPDTKPPASQATVATAKSGKAGAAKRAASPPPQAPTVAGTSQIVAPRAKRARKVAPKAEDDEDDPPKPVTKAKSEPTEAELVVGRGQIATRLDIAIPLDEGCPHSTHVVYIDPKGVIYDASLNQTNSGKNNNKFYRIQLLRSGTRYLTWTRWGRVGDRGQSATVGVGSLDDAMEAFEKKFKDKAGLTWAQRGEPPKAKKYAFVERSYEKPSDGEDDKPATAKADLPPMRPCTLEPAIQDLVKFIFNQAFFNATMAELKYDAKKLPLGQLSKATINRGFQTLKTLSALLDDVTLAPTGVTHNQAVSDLSDAFYSIIPHYFGRARPPVINTQGMVKREITTLENLSDMKDASLIMKLEGADMAMDPLTKQFEGLGMEEMTPLKHESTEFLELENYLQKTRGGTHYHVKFDKVEEIFRIEREGEKARFESSTYAKRPSAGKNRRLLWHGSRTTNYGGILSQGLRIAPPEAPVSGYMFDKGIYLADMSTKSAGYCYASTSDNTALLLLCEAELGDPVLELLHSNSSAATEVKKQGMISTLGLGSEAPLKWKDAGCVHPSLQGTMMPDVSKEPGPTGHHAALMYNEYICYDVAQVRLRYLLRVKTA